MAFELQAAKTKQRIMEEQMQVKVVERSQEIAVQEQEMLRRERELDATVRRPADAEKYRYVACFIWSNNNRKECSRKIEKCDKKNKKLDNRFSNR